MSMGIRCDCALCHIELRLLSDLSGVDSRSCRELFSESNSLQEFSSIAGLLSHLRTSAADSRSDELLRGLFAARATNPAQMESLLVIVFLPMLHGTIRRVARQQPGLSQDDISQQALSFLLQFLRSDELRARQSHFAFAIARAVKRQLFEWANRESTKQGLWNQFNGRTLDAFLIEQPFERYALLRHFLHRCVAKRLLTDSELNLLIDSQLNGCNGGEFADSNGTSSNAVRQKRKRLLTKLRRLAK